MLVSRTIPVMVLFFAVTASGCLSVEEFHIRYDVRADLSTRVRIDAFGIRSDASNEEEKKTEMKAFFDGGYLDVAAQCGIAGDPTVTFPSRTETGSDATLTGDAHHLLQALVAILEGCDFEISKKGSPLSVKIVDTEESLTGKGTLTIAYAGEVISSNAHSSDKNVLVWDVEKLSDSGIQFVLKTK